jgi:hypothetical protein
MSMDFSIKPVGASAGRSANNAVATELPAAQSVVAAGAGARVRDEAVLRRRAYFRALDLAGRAPRRLVVTDRMA